MSDEPAICEPGGGGIVLPLFGQAEQEWDPVLRVVLYLVGLFWCFMGVAIIADVFMAAIEKVTSKKVRRWDQAKKRFCTSDLWNPTVSNLTLMALGSSAPEILLNVIDIFAKDFYLEGLGPSTIVGSAAFNLLMIIAVCIVALPSGDLRYIKDMPVYVCTASWSVFAYLWLLLILVGITPNVVDVWEGLLTFFFFPILVGLAFACDKGWLGGAPKEESSCAVYKDMSPEELMEAQSRIRQEHGATMTDEQVARMLVHLHSKPKTRAHYRIGAIRKMFGGKRLRKTLLNFPIAKRKVLPVDFEETSKPSCSIGFAVEKYPVLEGAKEARVKVIREGDASMRAQVYYETRDGTAKEELDYCRVEGHLIFEAGQTEDFIRLKIVDDTAFEEDEDFFIVLSDPQALTEDSNVDPKTLVHLGEKSRIRVIIIDDDEPGVLSFEKDSLSVSQRDQEFKFPILVQRKHGTCGKISVKYVVEGDSALAGRDFDAASGTLEFDDKQMEAYISVTIKVVARYDNMDKFRVILSDPQGGAKLDDTRDGGLERNIATVTIEADADMKARTDQVMALLQKRWEKSKIGHSNWASQFKEAMYVNGGDNDDDDDGGEPPSKADYVFHALALPWKLLFALVPPTDYCGGWVCFFSALIMIGLVTMIIGDLASLLGCTLCIPDDITAITFVALGTSLPDTFASKAAATQDAHADASVGNVTGSNSVNVFLGLGLPWAIASIKWAVSGTTGTWDGKYQKLEGLDSLGAPGFRSAGFVVEAGSLSFSVAVFSTCAVACIILLAVRRQLFGGELGGPAGPAYASAGFLVSLWVLYVVLSAWKSVSEGSSSFCPH